MVIVVVVVVVGNDIWTSREKCKMDGWSGLFDDDTGERAKKGDSFFFLKKKKELESTRGKGKKRKRDWTHQAE